MRSKDIENKYKRNVLIYLFIYLYIYSIIYLLIYLFILSIVTSIQMHKFFIHGASDGICRCLAKSNPDEGRDLRHASGGDIYQIK